MDQIIQDKKVALVTGGGTGMGRAVAMAFSRAMIRLAVIDKNEEGEKTAEMIRGSGGEAFFIRADVTNQDDARHMVNKTIKTFGRLDYAFNNTNFFMESRSISGKIRSVSWDFVVGMNLIGIWLCMKYEVTQMLKNKQGSIVNLGSFTSRTGFLNNMTYMQAVNTWTKTAALEYNAYGLRVNAVCADKHNTGHKFQTFRKHADRGSNCQSSDLAEFR